MKRRIYTDDSREGIVFYDPSTKEVMVTHPDIIVRKLVRRYLTAVHTFAYPDPDGDTGRIFEKENANESINTIDQALTSMYMSIGVHVDWDSDLNTEHTDSIVQAINGTSKYSLI